MKIAVVPAQITTVEDRILGKLSFSQMMLLFIPVFISGGVFAIAPPMMEGAAYKYVLMSILVFVCCILAIRIRGKIIALWLVMILSYNLRPKYYVYNKNTVALREMYTNKHEEHIKEEDDKAEKKVVASYLDIPTTAKVRAALDDPRAKVRFEARKKGGLHVRITKIEE